MGKPSLLLVCARGGPPLSDVVPRIAAVTRLHVLKLVTLAPDIDRIVDQHCASVTDATAKALHGEALVDHIVTLAKSVQAEGVLTFSEFAAIATAFDSPPRAITGNPGMRRFRTSTTPSTT